MKPGFYDVWRKSDGRYEGRLEYCEDEEVGGFVVVQFAHGMDECPEAPRPKLEDGWYVAQQGSILEVVQKTSGVWVEGLYGGSLPRDFDEKLVVKKFPGPPEDL